MASMAAWCAGNAARFPGAWPAPGVRGCRSFCVDLGLTLVPLEIFRLWRLRRRPGCAAHRCELRILYAKYAYLFLGQPAKCEVAHTSPPRLAPSKSDWELARRDTETKTSEVCICRRAGVDHSSGYDVGFGSAGRATDLPSSTFACVLADKKWPSDGVRP